MLASPLLTLRRASTARVTTNEDGLYIAPNLLPATYELTFTAPGFRTDVRSGIELTVGATVTLNMTMQVGGSKEIVQVQTEAPDVQLATSDISAVVNATTVRELPLNGRSWTDLATLQPGVNRIQTQPDFSAGHGSGKPRVRTTVDYLRRAAAAEQLSLGRRQPQRLRQWSPRQRVGREPGCRCDSGIFRPDQQLLGGVWQDVRRRG